MRKISARLRDHIQKASLSREIVLPEPLPHQIEPLRDTHRHKRLICGRRWGKTALGLLAAVVGHGHPDPSHPRHFRGAIDGGNIYWVSPTFAISKKIERDIQKCFRNSGFEYLKGEARIEVPGGGSIAIKTAASPVGLRGDGLDGVIFDEAAFMEQEVWTEAMRPALSDKQGWSMFTTSPNGLNWVKDQHDLDGVDPAFRSWQLPSSLNPLMTPEELESAKLDVGERAFSQEYLAQFVDTEGAEFSGYYFQWPDFWFDEWPAPEKIRYRVVALDPSKGKTDKSDYSAFTMLALTHDGHVYIDADIERRDISRIAQSTVDICQAWRPHGLIVEANQFQELLIHQVVPIARAAGLEINIFPANNTANKTARIRSTLTPHLSRGELHFKRGSRGSRLLVEQLQEFPVGKYDDGPDSLEMGIRLLAHIAGGGR